MFKKDYIERMATQIAKMIAELLGYDTSERLEYVQEFLESMLDGDTSLVETLEGDALIQYLSEEKGLQLTEIELMGNLLHQRGKTQMEMDHLALAKPSFQKALTLVEHADEQMDIFSLERRALIQELIELIRTNPSC